MANVDIQIGYKDSAWFTANATLVLKVGQVVYLEQTGTYKIGDGITQLSVLSFLGAGSFVPYTGATSDVNLGEFGIQLGNLEFDNTPTNIPTNAGSVVWNDTDGTLDLKLKGGNVTLQIGQEQVARVVNKTATNITLLESNYQAVRVTGAQGQRLKVDLALATNDLLSAETIGLVTETILNNEEGFITTSGLVRGINTTGSLQSETWADGDIIYLSPTTAGNITNIKPIAPNHIVIIGYVVYAHITQGTIFVKVDNGYEIDELHNVLINGVANNDVLVYESSSQLWKNKTAASSLGYTPETIDNKSIDGTFAANNDTLYPSQKAVKTYADGLVTGLLDDRGNYDASSNLWPATGGSGVAGAILKGDLWYISVAGTLGGASAVIGSSIRALIDTPGQTNSNWSILNVGLGYTPENIANKSDSYTASSTTTYASTKALVDGLASVSNTSSIRIVNKDITNSSALTGTTAITLMKSILIPANTYATGDVVKLLSRAIRSTATGTAANLFYINTTNSLTGATLVGISQGAFSFYGMERSLYIKSSTISETLSNSISSGSEVATLSLATPNQNLNINWAVNQYVIAAFQNAAVGNSTVMSSLIIQKY